MCACALGQFMHAFQGLAKDLAEKFCGYMKEQLDEIGPEFVVDAQLGHWRCLGRLRRQLAYILKVRLPHASVLQMPSI